MALRTDICDLVKAGFTRDEAVALIMEKAGKTRDAKAAGVMVRAPDGDLLFTKRSPDAHDHPGEWDFPGGGIEGSETPEEAAVREMAEEIGLNIEPEFLGDLVGVEGEFNTYVFQASHKMTPKLNNEHDEYIWASPDMPPSPLHPGVAATLTAASPEYEVKPTADAMTVDRGYYAPTSVGKTRRLMPNGTLVCESVGLARTGQQIYSPKDLPGLPPGMDGRIVVDRSEDEVFHPDTIASFESAPVTLNHPNKFVDPTNWRQLAIGHVTNVRRGEGDDKDLLVGDVIITDAAAIHHAMQTMPDISCGYDAKYKSQGPGKATQHQIRGNHAALVRAGRAGDRCAIQDHNTTDLGEFEAMSKKTFWSKAATYLTGKGLSAQDVAGLRSEVEPIITHDDDGDDTMDAKKITDSVMDAVSKAMDEKLKPMRDWQSAYDAKCKTDEEEKKKVADAAAAEAKKEKTGDILITAEDPGTVIDLGKVWTGTTGDQIMTEIRSRAEVIAPGMMVPTTDSLKGNQGAVLTNFLRMALVTHATKDEAGKAEVASFTFGKKPEELAGYPLIGAFNGVYELAKIRNNAKTRQVAGGLKTQDGTSQAGIARMTVANASANYASNLAKARAAMGKS